MYVMVPWQMPHLDSLLPEVAREVNVACQNPCVSGGGLVGQNGIATTMVDFVLSLVDRRSSQLTRQGHVLQHRQPVASLPV